MIRLAVCAMLKDERYLEEWIDYHILAGVERFYLYDDGSSQPLRRRLSHYVEAGLAEVFAVAPSGTQLSVYKDCLRRTEGLVKWVAFLDGDEFLVPKEDRDLRVFLSWYGDYAGVAVNWVVFSSNGLLTRPKGLQIENYTHRLLMQSPFQRRVKSIVRPELAKRPLSSHNFLYRDGNYCVNEEYVGVTDPFSYHCSQRIQINHYYYRSQQDFYEKSERGDVLVDAKTDRKDKYTLQKFIAQSRASDEPDNAISSYIARLKALPASPAQRVQTLLRQNRHAARDSLQSFLQGSAEELRTGRVQEALNLLGVATLDFPQAIQAWILRSRFLRETGNTERALDAAKYALRYSGAPEAIFEYYHALKSLGRNHEAHETGRYLLMRMRNHWPDYRPYDDSLKEIS